MMRTLSIGLVVGATLTLFACDARVDVQGKGGGAECDGPPPPTFCATDFECVDGEWVEIGGGECACPASKPASGAPCSAVGMSCQYPDEQPCGPTGTVTATCAADGWQLVYSACQPEPTCPLELPLAGSDCSEWEYPYFCQYNVGCDGEAATVSFDCDYSTSPPSWRPYEQVEGCGPCEAIGTAEACSVAAGCRWLEPGCGAQPLAAGCYPAADCASAMDCPFDLECVPRSYDPCWLASCDACDATAYVCE